MLPTPYRLVWCLLDIPALKVLKNNGSEEKNLPYHVLFFKKVTHITSCVKQGISRVHILGWWLGVGTLLAENLTADVSRYQCDLLSLLWFVSPLFTE